MLDTARPDVEPPRRSLAAGDESSWSTTRWCCCAASSDDRAARDVPAAARRGLRLRRRRASSCPTCATSAISHLYLPPSFQARDGLHARLRRRRPGLDLERARAARRSSSRWSRAAREAGLGIVLDIVPNHMATDDANRFWSDPAAAARSSSTSTRRPAATGASSTSTTWPRVRQEDPEVFDGDARSWRCGWCARASWTGCGSTIRTGSPIRRATWRGCATGGVEHVWVEKILDPGEHAARLAGRGHGRLRVPQRRLRAVRRPRGRGAADRPVGRGHPATTGASASWRSRPSSSRRGRRSRPRSSGCCARRPQRVAGLERALASLPVYRTYVEPWSGRVEDADREAVAEAGLPALAGVDAAARACRAGTRSSRASSRRRRR